MHGRTLSTRLHGRRFSLHCTLVTLILSAKGEILVCFSETADLRNTQKARHRRTMSSRDRCPRRINVKRPCTCSHVFISNVCASLTAPLPIRCCYRVNTSVGIFMLLRKSYKATLDLLDEKLRSLCLLWYCSTRIQKQLLCCHCTTK